MPRPVRGLVDGYVYHVLNRGNAKQTVFHKEFDYRVFIGLIGDFKERFPGVKLLAYCLMPNHFHFVLRPEQGGDLSKFMQQLVTTHVLRYHKHYGTSGHLWQGRFKSFVIQDDDHLLTVLRYVEGNPVRARLADSAEKWPWSSHRERVQGARVLVDESPIELPADWRAYVDEPLTPKELETLRESVVRQSPFGERIWCLQAARELGFESTLRPRGRPRKV